MLSSVRAPRWTLRPASADDREFLYELNRAALGPYIEATWGWDEDEQARYFDRRLDPSRRRIIQVGNREVGELLVDADETHAYLRADPGDRTPT